MKSITYSELHLLLTEQLMQDDAYPFEGESLANVDQLAKLLSDLVCDEYDHAILMLWFSSLLPCLERGETPYVSVNI